MTTTTKRDVNNMLEAGELPDLDDAVPFPGPTPANDHVSGPVLDDAEDARDADERKKAMAKRRRQLQRAMMPFAYVADVGVPRLKARARQEEKRIEFPFTGVNDITDGGLWETANVYVGGTGVWKTQFMLQTALHCAEKQVPVLYIALEMGPIDTTARVFGLASTTRGWGDLYNGRGGEGAVAEIDALQAATKNLRIEVLTAPPMGFGLDDIEIACEVFRERYPQSEHPRALIVFDFLQLIDCPPGDDLRMAIRATAYRCRELTIRLGLTFLVVSSTARENYVKLAGDMAEALLQLNGEVHGQDSLIGLGKESGEIEYACDNLFVSIRRRVPDVGTVIILVAAKQRANVPRWAALVTNGHRLRDPTPDEFVKIREFICKVIEKADQRGGRRKPSKSDDDDDGPSGPTMPELR